MSRPSTTTAALLPALSAALGLLRRLDGASGRGDAGADDTVDGPSRGDTDTAGGRRASTSTTGPGEFSPVPNPRSKGTNILARLGCGSQGLHYEHGCRQRAK